MRTLEVLSVMFVNTLLPRDWKLVLLDNWLLHLYEGTDCTLSPVCYCCDGTRRCSLYYLAWYLSRALAREDKPSKRATLSTVLLLLVQVPEGAQVLLAMLVNKIGNPAQKIRALWGTSCGWCWMSIPQW
jgi:hypothetical protein